MARRPPPGLNAELPPQEISERYNGIFDTVVTELEGRGIHLSTDTPNTSIYQGFLPSNLPDMPAKELGVLMVETKIWGSFVNSLLAACDAERTTTLEAMKVAEAIARRRFSGGEEKKYEKDDSVRLDARVVDLRERFLRSEAKYIILRAANENAIGAYEVVSREISRREIDMNSGIRVGNIVSRRGRPSRAAD